jgi:hypothetical protein
VGFALFILVTATMFIRPSELVPTLAGLPIYNVLISACLLASLPQVMAQLGGRSLAETPISACVVGLLPAAALSRLSHQDFSGIGDAVDFGKVILYYLLLVGLIDSPARLSRFLRMLVVSTAVLTVLALLQYHGLIDIEALQSIYDQESDEQGGDSFVLRLCSTGIFHDPNDLSMILIVAMGACLFQMGGRRPAFTRLLWLGTLVLFGYALTKTHSRGGFLALLAGLMVLFHSRFGWKRAVPLLALALPAAFVLFAGRQTNISTDGDTGQDRIRLWAEGFALLRGSPIFGIGQNRYAEEVGLVAHNSFIHGFTELGVLGGALFTGAFASAFLTLRALGARSSEIRDPELRRLRPYLMAMVAAYAFGLLTISRNYVIPTYLVLGLAVTYVRLVAADSGLAMPRFDLAFVGRLGAMGVAFLVAASAFVRVFARFGG